MQQSRAIEHGQTMAEYAVVLALLLLACVAVFPLLSSAVAAMIGQIANALH
ncbi:MAG: hypothetical protein JWM86_941 [Thermoleophilia bacterium]|nr:hypothetical protein [Thermoleophilia bacterium]